MELWFIFYILGIRRMNKLVATSPDNFATTEAVVAMKRSPDVPMGDDPRYRNFVPSPPHRPLPDTAYCDMLPPGPRAQDLTQPSQTRKYRKFQMSPFRRGTEYLVRSVGQNIIGLVDGGPSNANWVRGNQFGNAFSYKGIWGRKKFTIPPLPKPGPNKLEKIPSPFYPFFTFFDRFKKRYKSYPSEERDSYHGTQPTYVFPYYTYNNRDRSPLEKDQQTKLQLVEGVGDTKVGAEGFSNRRVGNGLQLLPLIFGILLLFLGIQYVC